MACVFGKPKHRSHTASLHAPWYEHISERVAPPHCRAAARCAASPAHASLWPPSLQSWTWHAREQ